MQVILPECVDDPQLLHALINDRHLMLPSSRAFVIPTMIIEDGHLLILCLVLL
jgi:hypothetical protein